MPHPLERKIEAPLLLAIIVVPFLAVWFLLRDGYTAKARLFGFLWLATFVLFLSHGHTPLATPDSSLKSAGEDWQPKDRLIPKEAKFRNSKNPVGITSGMFDAITPGSSSYSKLSPLIGPGELSSSSGSVRIYLWNNGDGSGMTLGVDGDKIVSKAQVGLYR